MTKTQYPTARARSSCCTASAGSRRHTTREPRAMHCDSLRPDLTADNVTGRRQNPSGAWPHSAASDCCASRGASCAAAAQRAPPQASAMSVMAHCSISVVFICQGAVGAPPCTGSAHHRQPCQPPRRPPASPPAHWRPGARAGRCSLAAGGLGLGRQVRGLLPVCCLHLVAHGLGE